jgi:hypothetical protein
MEMTDISELAARAAAAAEAIVAADPPGRTASGRTCSELASELAESVRLVPEVVAQADAFLDINAGEPLTDELQDVAARGAAALLLGRRLLESNATEMVGLQPRLADDLREFLPIAAILDGLSAQLVLIVQPHAEWTDLSTGARGQGLDRMATGQHHATDRLVVEENGATYLRPALHPGR